VSTPVEVPAPPPTPPAEPGDVWADLRLAMDELRAASSWMEPPAPRPSLTLILGGRDA
jgi:hypothetical protein